MIVEREDELGCNAAVSLMETCHVLGKFHLIAISSLEAEGYIDTCDETFQIEVKARGNGSKARLKAKLRDRVGDEAEGVALKLAKKEASGCSWLEHVAVDLISGECCLFVDVDMDETEEALTETINWFELHLKETLDLLGTFEHPIYEEHRLPDDLAYLLMD